VPDLHQRALQLAARLLLALRAGCKGKGLVSASGSHLGEKITSPTKGGCSLGGQAACPPPWPPLGCWGAWQSKGTSAGCMQEGGGQGKQGQQACIKQMSHPEGS